MLTFVNFVNKSPVFSMLILTKLTKLTCRPPPIKSDEIFIRLFKPKIEEFVGEKKESHHRFAAELITSVTRGSKHWTFSDLQKMWDTIIPLIAVSSRNNRFEGLLTRYFPNPGLYNLLTYLIRTISAISVTLQFSESNGRGIK